MAFALGLPLLLLQGDAAAGYAPLPQAGGAAGMHVGWAAYDQVDGSTLPKLVDLDADGRSELVVGFDLAGDDRLRVLEDATQGFAPHASVADPEGFAVFETDQQVAPAPRIP